MLSSMKSLFAFLVASATAQTEFSQVENQFIQYIVEHGKSYATKEDYEARLALFAEANEQILALNSLNGSATFGHNFFSDMTDEEKKQFMGQNRPQEVNEKFKESIQVLTDGIDWRDLGAVNPVKVQGSCGSSWAFSAVSSIESHHYIATGELLKLSEQQVVDCDPLSNGCSGGFQEWAMEYAKSNPLALESEYSNVSKDQVCSDDQFEGKVSVVSIHYVEPRSASQLKAAIEQGPVAVSVEAGQNGFLYYTSGILSMSACSGQTTDHGVSAVGWGSENGQDYYIVRNQWGDSWGESGYIRIATQESGNGVCGIQQTNVWADTN